jgi:hypothetical protein
MKFFCSDWDNKNIRYVDNNSWNFFQVSTEQLQKNSPADKINLSLRIIQVPAIIRNKNGAAPSEWGVILIKRKNLVKPYLTIKIPFVRLSRYLL